MRGRVTLTEVVPDQKKNLDNNCVLYIRHILRVWSSQAHLLFPGHLIDSTYQIWIEN